jgi:hypothetical protein
MKIDNIEVLSHNEVADLIEANGDTRTILVQGENGIGKTSIWHALRKRPRFANYHCPKPVDCAKLDLGDHSVPMPIESLGIVRNLPNEHYGVNEKNQKGVNGSRPILCMLDELAKAQRHIQASLAPWFFDRRIGSYEAPEGSVIFATTNLAIEGLGDFMQGHTRNRLIIVTMRKPTRDEWVNDFAIPHNLSPEIIAATEHNRNWFDSFLDYEEGGAMQGKNLSKDNPYIFDPRNQSQTGYITPRSLHAASDIIIKSAHLPPHVVGAALGGTLGYSGAKALEAYVTFGRQLPTGDRIKQDPKNCPVPESSTAQIVLVFKLVTIAKNRSDAEAICTYVDRLREEMQSLFLNTVAQNTEKVAIFASVPKFLEMLKKHRIFFERGEQ